MDNRPRTRVNHMEPLARAFSRSVSEHPADGGLFGPQSVVWRMHRDRSFPLAALRSLMVQALHPLAMAGVAEHSNWKEDPFGRLAATSGYILTVTYGDTGAAHKAADRVRAIHEHVNGPGHGARLSRGRPKPPAVDPRGDDRFDRPRRPALRPRPRFRSRGSIRVGDGEIRRAGGSSRERCACKRRRPRGVHRVG